MAPGLGSNLSLVSTLKYRLALLLFGVLIVLKIEFLLVLVIGIAAAQTRTVLIDKSPLLLPTTSLSVCIVRVERFFLCLPRCCLLLN